MKKIFTLFAVAAMALTAGAQEKALFDYSTTYQDGQVISTAKAKLTLGNDMKEWKTAASKISAESYLSDFGQTVTITNDDGEQVEQFSVVTVTGSNNPKDQAESGKGSGINCSEGKTSARLPQNGSYYIFTPTVSGKVQAGIVLNVDKPLYLIDATDAVATEDGYLEVALPAANLHNYVVKDAEGNEVALADASDGKGGMVVSDKVTGTLEFDAEAGKTYYFFCAGSKLGCFGYIFTPSGEAPNLVETILWEGEALVTGWANQPYLLSDGGVELSNVGAKVGDILRFYMSAPDNTWQLELIEGHWGPQYVRWSEQQLYNEDGSERESVIVDLTNVGYAEITITEEMLANALASKGWGGVFVLNGDGNLTVTKLSLLSEGGYVPPQEGEKVSLIDYFTSNWNGEETNTHNADGTVTYNGKQWGGLSAWLCDEEGNPTDWSSYTKLVFEFAEPTPAACQGFVQCVGESDDVNNTWWGNAGITKLECPFEDKDMSQVKQAALQAAEEATYQISAIYLVKNIDPEGIEERVYVVGFDANAPVYNLAGMRVGKDYKGIVIQNGRKFIQK